MQENSTLPLSQAGQICLKVAEGRAKRRGNTEVTPPFLFLGIAGAERDWCEQVLEQTHEIELALLEHLPKGTAAQYPGTTLPLSAESRLCIRRAFALAGLNGLSQAEPSHLLFAVIEHSAEMSLALAEVNLTRRQILEGLAQATGLPEIAGERSLACGPLMLDRLGLGLALGQRLADARAQPEPGPMGDTYDRLLQVFSQIGPAFVLSSQDRPAEALAALKAVHCAGCDGQSEQKVVLDANEASLHICRSTCKQFARRNPGYAALPDGQMLFRRHGLELALHAHTQLVEHSLALANPDVQTAFAAWEDSKVVALQIGKESEVRDYVVDVTLGRVNALEQARKLDDAIALLSSVNASAQSARLSGRLAEMLTNRGVKAGNAQDWGLAIGDLRQAMAISPSVPRIRTNLAIALMGKAATAVSPDERIKELIETRAFLEECVRLDERNQDYQEKLAMVQAMIAMSSTAPAKLQEFLDLTSSEAGNLIVEADRNLERQQWSKAEELLNKAAAQAPNSASVWVRLTKALVPQEKFREAIAAQRRVAELDPAERYNVHRNCSGFFLQLKDYVAAEREIRAAIEINPDDAEDYLGLGIALHKQNRLQEAKEVYQVAASKDRKAALLATLAITAIDAELGHSAPGGSHATSEADAAQMLSGLLEGLLEEARSAGAQSSPGAPAREQDLRSRLASALSLAAADVDENQLTRNTRRVNDMLKEAGIKFRRSDDKTLLIPYSAKHVDSVLLEATAFDDFLFIRADIPQPDPVQEEQVLYHWLRATFYVDSVKITRDDDDGELAVAAEIPITILTPEILKGFLSGMAHLVDLPRSSLAQPSVIEDRGREVVLELGLQQLLEAQDKPKPKPGFLGKLFAKGQQPLTPEELIPQSCARHGWQCEPRGDARFTISLLSTVMSLKISAICKGRSVSLIAVFGGYDTPQDRPSFYRRLAEVNLEMDICKVALDKDDDLVFMVELPAVDDPTLADAVERIRDYALRYGLELRLLA